MAKSESKYFNTAALMDEALIKLLEKKICNTLQSKKSARRQG